MYLITEVGINIWRFVCILTENYQTQQTEQVSGTIRKPIVKWFLHVHIIPSKEFEGLW